MKIAPNLLAVTFITAMVTVASAQAGPLYLGVNAGASRLRDFCANSASGFDCKNTTLAYGLDGGYQITEKFGAELGYGLLGTPKTTGTLFGSAFEVSQQVTGAKLAGTFTFPVNKSFAVTGKLGAIRTNSMVTSASNPGPGIPSYSAFNTSVMYGVGIKYSFNESLAMRIQYENIVKIGDETMGTDNLSLLTAGVTYSFGQMRSSATPKQSTAQTRSVTRQPPLRAAVFLEQPAPENKQALTAAIARACQCEPIFVRMYGATSVIYQVELLPEQTFSDFKKNLLSNSAALGIKGLMQNL